jgi:1-pyrroline-5-carboxylate dehydrogenase
VFRRAGVPDGVINLVTGPGEELGEALVHSDVDGIVFTGSRAVGERMIMSAASRERHVPVIAEMGGKNAIIVTEKADLDKAVEGVAKAAFGYSGQKCSACSRLFVHDKVYDTFVSKLVEYTASLKVGDPLEKDTFTGPVISEAKVKQFLQCADMAGKDGRVLTGGKRITSEFLEQGNYVELTIVDSLPDDHYLMRTELFLPFLCVTRADSLEDAIARANAVDYGLTAGIFSEDADELYAFFRDIEAGVVYANRRRSGSSGAMVGSQAFGGWKASGSTGKGTGSVYYLPQFMREQSRTVVNP